MSQALADRNLLFGVLAVQMDFISRDLLVAAMQSWARDKSKSIGDILRDQKAIEADEQELLDSLVTKHLARHGNNLARCLESVGPASPIRDALSAVTDAMIQSSLGFFPTAGGASPQSGATAVDEYATRVGTQTGAPSSVTSSATTEAPAGSA